MPPVSRVAQHTWVLGAGVQIFRGTGSTLAPRLVPAETGAKLEAPWTHQQHLAPEQEPPRVPVLLRMGTGRLRGRTEGAGPVSEPGTTCGASWARWRPSTLPPCAVRSHWHPCSFPGRRAHFLVCSVGAPSAASHAARRTPSCCDFIPT